MTTRKTTAAIGRTCVRRKKIARRWKTARYGAALHARRRQRPGERMPGGSRARAPTRPRTGRSLPLARAARRSSRKSPTAMRRTLAAGGRSSAAQGGGRGRGAAPTCRWIGARPARRPPRPMHFPHRTLTLSLPAAAAAALRPRADRGGRLTRAARASSPLRTAGRRSSRSSSTTRPRRAPRRSGSSASSPRTPSPCSRVSPPAPSRRASTSSPASPRRRARRGTSRRMTARSRRPMQMLTPRRTRTRMPTRTQRARRTWTRRRDRRRKRAPRARKARRSSRRTAQSPCRPRRGRACIRLPQRSPASSSLCHPRRAYKHVWPAYIPSLATSSQAQAAYSQLPLCSSHPPSAYSQPQSAYSRLPSAYSQLQSAYSPRRSAYSHPSSLHSFRPAARRTLESGLALTRQPPVHPREPQSRSNSESPAAGAERIAGTSEGRGQAVRAVVPGLAALPSLVEAAAAWSIQEARHKEGQAGVSAKAADPHWLELGGER